MAFIASVPPTRARGETAAAYAELRRMAGGGAAVANIVRIFSLRPGSMRRMIRSWELTMWVGSEPRPTRELVAATISRLNNCHY
jgi:alkylhydroperoxidase family enzyme